MTRQLDLIARAPVTLVVDNDVHLPRGLPDEVVEAVARLCRYPNPAVRKLRKLGKVWAAKQVPQVIDLALDERGGLAVPRGLGRKVAALLRARGYPVRYEVRTREAPAPDMPAFRGERRGYQEAAVEALRGSPTMLGVAPGGSGKTALGLLAAATLRQRTLAIVYTRGVLQGWISDCKKLLGIAPRVVGGGARWTPPTSSPVTVATQQALWHDRLAAEEPHYGLVVPDECGMYAARTLRETVRAFRARYRLGLSEDPTRRDEAEPLVYAMFGDPVEIVGRTELVEAGEVLPVDLRVVRTGWVPRDEAGRPIPTENVGEICAACGRQRSDPAHARGGHHRHKPTTLLDLQAADEGRNREVARWVLREVGPGNTALVLAPRIATCHWLHQALNRGGLPTRYLLGGQQQSAVDFERTRRDMQEGRLRCAVGSSAVFVGFNLPRLDRGFVVSPGAFNAQLLGQQVSRFMRPVEGKEPARVYLFVDGLTEEDDRLSADANRALLRQSHARLAGVRRFVARDPARFVDARILSGGEWRPLSRR